MFENYCDQSTVKNDADCLHPVASYGLTGSTFTLGNTFITFLNNSTLDEELGRAVN